MNERNLKYYRVPERWVFSVWKNGCNRQRLLELPDLKIPDDAQVLAVYHEPSHKTFDFLVSHPSFPEVPDGDLIPCEPGIHVEWKVLALVDPAPTVVHWKGPTEDIREARELAREFAEKTGQIVALHSPLENVKSVPDVIAEGTGTWEELADGTTIFRNLRDPLPEDTWVRIDDPRGGKWLKNVQTVEIVQDIRQLMAEEIEKLERVSQDVAVHPPTPEEVKRAVDDFVDKKRGYEFL